MEVIHYLTDENNNKVAVQIDLKKYGEYWQDFYDGLLAELTKDEETISVEELGVQLRSKGLLDVV